MWLQQMELTVWLVLLYFSSARKHKRELHTVTLEDAPCFKKDLTGNLMSGDPRCLN